MEKKPDLKDPKTKEDSYPKRSLYEILRQGAGSSGAPLRGAGATSEPAVQVSAKDRDKPVGRYLPEVTSRTSLLGTNSSADIQLQGASSSSTPAEGEGLRQP
jgi:hypothetical protein